MNNPYAAPSTSKGPAETKPPSTGMWILLSMLAVFGVFVITSLFLLTPMQRPAMPVAVPVPQQLPPDDSAEL